MPVQPDHGFNLLAPAEDYAAVTTGDTSASNFVPCRALYVGSGGDLVAISPLGSQVTFVGVPTGTVLPIQAIRVNSTSTTAASIVALY